MADPAAANALYADGGTNPAGHPEAIKDPRAADAPSVPVAQAAPVVTQAAPAAPATEAVKAADAAPVAGAEAGLAEKVEPPAAIDPASYELKFSDGFQVDDALLGEFRTTAAELRLAPEAAQKFAALYEKAVGAIAPAIAAANQAQFSQQQQQWETELQAMPELQGEARERNITYLGRLIDEFGTPEVKAYLNSTGAGNNPAIVRMFLNIGEALMEGEPVTASRPANVSANSGQRRSGASVLYPNQAT